MKVSVLACALWLAAGCACGEAPAIDGGGGDSAVDAALDGGLGRIVDLDTGRENNCVVLRDGRLVCWGSYLPPGIEELTGGVDQVGVGVGEVCVRRGTGIECRSHAELPPNPILDVPARDFIDVDVDSNRACGRTPAREVICWGVGPEVGVALADELRMGSAGGACARDGTSAECWLEAASASSLPGDLARLAPPNLWARCGLTSAGEVTCDPTCWLVDAPDLCPFDWATDVGPGPGGAFVQLELPDRQYFACALRASGEIACWGKDYDTPPFGEGPSLRDLEPSGLRFRDIGVGGGHVCGVTLDDRVVCWGFNAEAIDVPAELR